MEDNLLAIQYLIQDPPGLGYVSEDKEEPYPWPEPIFQPREVTNIKGSFHIKETVREAKEREILQSNSQPNFVQQFEDQKFWEYQKKCSRKNWDSRRAWLNARVQEQVEADYQKKLHTWKEKLEAEYDPEEAAERLQVKVQELQEDKFWWKIQLEHQWELPQGIPSDGPSWETSTESSWNTVGDPSAWI